VPLVLLVVATSACAASQEPTPSPSATASTGSASATPTEAASTPQPTPIPTAAPPTSSNALFSLLPAAAPPGHRQQISCSGDIGPSDPVAIVELKGNGRDVVPRVMRNYADPANPRTVCDFGGESIEQLIDARHVVIQNCDGLDCVLAVVDLPEVRYHWFALPDGNETNETFIAVSPKLDEVAWSSTDDNPADFLDQNRRLHLTRADGDHVMAHLRPVGGRCGSGDDSKSGAYSGSGAHVYALDVPIANDTVFVGLHGLDRVFMFRPPRGGWPMSEQPAQPVWSPTDEVLYYRRAGSVWQWTPAGGEELYLPDTYWQSPTISPDGRYLAYSVPKDGGSSDTFVIDLKVGGAPELIGEDRSSPVFLMDTQLWLMEATGSGCVSAEEPQRLIYDINEAAESNSIIDTVFRVWPATSAQR
jgi:hypothetical protein